jgi:hypothetical protein
MGSRKQRFELKSFGPDGRSEGLQIFADQMLWRNRPMADEAISNN